MKQDTYLHILKKGNINIKKKARGINKTSASKYLISEHLEKKKFLSKKPHIWHIQSIIYIHSNWTVWLGARLNMTMT